VGVGTLSVSPSLHSILIGATTPDFTVTLTDTTQAGNPAIAGAVVTVTLPGTFVFGPGPAVGQKSWSFTTSETGMFSFSVSADANNSSSGDASISSTAASAPVVAKVVTIGFAGWGYNASVEGQVRTGAGNQATPYYMPDTSATTAITATGGTWAGFLWADQAGRMWGRGFNLAGTLGWNGGNAAATTPQRAAVIGGAPLEAQIVHIARGTDRHSSMAVDSDGGVWAAGDNAENGFAAETYTNGGYWKPVATHPSFTAARGTAKVTAVEFSTNGGAVYLLDDGRVLLSGR